MEDESMAKAGALFRVVVVGLGIAGRARLRDLPKLSDLYEETEAVQIAGFVSRRSIGAVEGLPQLTLEDAMDEKSNIRAVIISTENQRHAELAKLALQAKKHVLVDYPIATNAPAAKELQKIARENNVICYEESIALLSDQFKALKILVKAQEPLMEATLNMQGGFNRWNEDFEASGSPFHCGVNLIHTLVDLFGDLTPISSEIHRSESEISAKGVMQTKDKRSVNVNITRGPGRKRAKSFKYLFTDGSVIDENTSLSILNENLPQGLFARDFLQFMRTVTKEQDHSYNQWLMIRAIEIADDLFTMAKNNASSSI